MPKKLPLLCPKNISFYVLKSPFFTEQFSPSFSNLKPLEIPFAYRRCAMWLLLMRKGSEIRGQ